MDNEQATAERFADSEFTKYVNKDGNPCQKLLRRSSLFEQEEVLVHFSYEASNEKFLLVDVKGVDYNLYDPGVATIETLIEAPSAEEFFYISNLRGTTINNFLQHTKVSYFVLS